MDEIYEDAFDTIDRQNKLLEVERRGKGTYLLLAGRRFERGREEELLEFYRKHLERYFGREDLALYGNSPEAIDDLSQRDTWGVYNTREGRKGEWAIDLAELFDKKENIGFVEVLENVGAATLAAVTLAESFEGERPEDYNFYRKIVQELRSDRTPTTGMVQEENYYELGFSQEGDSVDIGGARDSSSAIEQGERERDKLGAERIEGQERFRSIEDSIERLGEEFDKQLDDMREEIDDLSEGLGRLERQLGKNQIDSHDGYDNYGVPEKTQGDTEEKLERIAGSRRARSLGISERLMQKLSSL